MSMSMCMLYMLLCMCPRASRNGDPSRTGAPPFMALLVANTDAAVGACLQIWEARPELLPRAHVPGSPFEGENGLHVLAVNRRESEFIFAIELAAERLHHGQCKELLHGRVSGPFFMAQPMEFYGATVLSYAVAFSLHRAVAALLLLSSTTESMQGLSDLNSSAVACPRTGLYPIHIAVANGLTKMFDFLQQLPGLPECRSYRADPRHPSHSVDWGPVGSLTALQLACYLGDHRMFVHIMKRRARINWSWGPVTEYRVHLEGIDSSGHSDNDVMTLIAKPDALHRTKEMMDESFLDGLIYDLFAQKWANYGKFINNLFLAFDIICTPRARSDLLLVTPCTPCYSLSCTPTPTPPHAVVGLCCGRPALGDPPP